jgi:hypothetical protein
VTWLLSGHPSSLLLLDTIIFWKVISESLHSGCEVTSPVMQVNFRSPELYDINFLLSLIVLIWLVISDNRYYSL